MDSGDQNLGGGQPGNRQDNRQRGNAAQLLEKYKSMARDAQLAGDRVQTEYYLQFADHYFRVLSESRSRFEEQNPRRQRDDDMDDEDETATTEIGRGGGEDGEPPTSVAERQDARATAASATSASAAATGRGATSATSAPPRRPRGSRAAQVNGGGETIPFDVLPPAIGREPQAEAAEAADEEPRRPRRRTRAPRPTEGDDEIAPAA